MYDPVKIYNSLSNAYIPSNPLERTVSSYASQSKVDYSISSPSEKKYESTISYTQPIFLNPDRPITRFIGKAEEIKDLIEETFKLTTRKSLPPNIAISIVSKEKLRKLHSEFGEWSDGIQGFAVNKTIPEIFVKENNLDLLMLTIGHELGHVLTKSLNNKHDEEAKAFAFEMAWIETIIEHNIGGLKNSFNLDPKPANNGLHDRAFDFIKNLLQKEKKSLEIYWELADSILKMDMDTTSWLWRIENENRLNRTPGIW